MNVLLVLWWKTVTNYHKLVDLKQESHCGLKTMSKIILLVEQLKFEVSLVGKREWIISGYI